jgi:hypothetical protein
MTYSAWSVVASEQPTSAKWNLLGSNDDYFYSVLGDSTAWTNFTPSYEGISVGNGTNIGKYLKIGKRVIVQTYFAFGGTSSVSSVIYLDLPVLQAAHYDTGNFTPAVGQAVRYVSATGALYQGPALYWGGFEQIAPHVLKTDGTSGQFVHMADTVPAAWASTDELHLSFSYEAA